jgi:hypothetical protein
MMKHIVHILASSGTGGMESHVQTLCNALATRFRVTLIVPVVAPRCSPDVQVIALKSLAGLRWNPLVLAEALHAHCPVVSTAVGGMVGFLPECALTPSGDSSALRSLPDSETLCKRQDLSIPISIACITRKVQVVNLSREK